MIDSGARRRALVNQLRERGALHDARVARAFLQVPREVFVPGLPLDAVYRDDAIVTKLEAGVGVSSSSQPAVMSLMLEQLDLFPGARVLEIGAGTGYNAALLRELVGEQGSVVTVDIDEEVAGWARERLDSAGYADVAVLCADGANGWPPGAPFDRIELTVGADDIALAWFDQLSDGGVLVLPLWVRTGQLSIAFEKEGERLRSRSAAVCGFIRMRGQMAGGFRPTIVAPGVAATLREPDDNATIVRALLQQTPRVESWDTGVWEGFSIFAGLWGLPLVGVWADSSSTCGFRGVGYAVLDEEGMSLAVVAADEPSAPPRLHIFGGMAAAQRLRAARQYWESLGRPGVDRLDIIAYRLPAAPEPASGAIPIDTRWWRLIITLD